MKDYIKIHLCPSPDLYALYHRDGATVIVTDIFRASTTITTALANGAEGVMPVASTEECETIGTAGGYLMAAERNVVRCPFAHLGNDPLEYVPSLVSGRGIVITTTNGTRSLTIAHEHGASVIMVGSFLNLDPTLHYCASIGIKEVIVVGAGWQGQASMEDCLYAGALAHRAESLGIGRASTDMAIMMRDLWREHCTELEQRISYMRTCEHYQRLLRAGHADAVRYCLTERALPAVRLDDSGVWLRCVYP